MLLKNELNKNGAIIEKNDFKENVYVKTKIENVNKIIWKSKYVQPI
jgi:hypothetical protein